MSEYELELVVCYLTTLWTLKCTDGFCFDTEQCIVEYFLLEKFQDCHQGGNGTKPSKSKQNI